MESYTREDPTVDLNEFLFSLSYRGFIKSTDQPTTDQLPTDQPIDRHKIDRPTEKILFQRLDN